MLAIWYVIEFVKIYIVAFHILNLQKKKSVKTLNAVAICFLLVADISRIIHQGMVSEYFTRPFISLGAVLIVMLLVMPYSMGKLKGLLLLLGIHFFTHLIDLLIGGLIISILPISMYEIMKRWLYVKAIAIISIPLLIFLSYIVKRNYVDLNLKLLNKKELFLLIVGILLSGYYITALQIQGDGSMGMSQLFGVAAGLGNILVIVIVVVLVIKMNEVKMVKYDRGMQDKLMKEQNSRYLSLLEQDKETRKYRHDMNVRLQVLSYLLIEKKLDELQEQINSLILDFNELQKETRINTGSEIVNVVLSDLKAQYEEACIKLEWLGKIPENIKITNNDVAILFSNLLRNAFEATMKYEGEKVINIQTTLKGSRFYASVKNRCTAGAVSDDNHLETNKKDKLNHGYGIGIIKEIVEKYGGHATFSSNNEVFMAEVIFSDIIE